MWLRYYSGGIAGARVDCGRLDGMGSGRVSKPGWSVSSPGAVVTCSTGYGPSTSAGQRPSGLLDAFAKDGTKGLNCPARLARYSTG